MTVVHAEDVARRLATAGFMAFAPDGLTSLGGYPGNEEEGAANFGKGDRNKMAADFVAAAKWLKNRPDCTGKLGAVGFCFGPDVRSGAASGAGGHRCSHRGLATVFGPCGASRQGVGLPTH